MLDEASGNEPLTCSNHCSSTANWESDWYLKDLDSLIRAPQEQTEPNGRDALRFHGGAIGSHGEEGGAATSFAVRRSRERAGLRLTANAAPTANVEGEGLRSERIVRERGLVGVGGGGIGERGGEPGSPAVVRAGGTAAGRRGWETRLATMSPSPATSSPCDPLRSPTHDTR